ncbi:DUF3102 domain-containing protein [Ancylobacter oerskovii]|uniref:DUF3102 domain-containing protein n=1 Tax=Ancylobacter oerskovii TaxID=459519 RepID=A0ABW4Z391_9HYPH|nr:DUF3102 domain-containing protein [Ancylobacter oerskovii]MBS7546273.1 DUF3102 domain-containing protein [Ancylobacter oerskovii]
MQLAAESIIEVGRELSEQKEALGHSNFMQWVDAEFEMSQASANRFMQVAERFGSNSSRVINLLPSALYALAAPSTPEPVREAVLERAEAGEREDFSTSRQRFGTISMCVIDYAMENNLEARARAICEADLRLGSAISESAMASAVDRYWRVVAREILHGDGDHSDISHRDADNVDAIAYRALRTRYDFPGNLNG